MSTEMRTYSTLRFRGSSASWRATSSSLSDTGRLQNFVGVDVFDALACLIAGDLALRRVALGHPQERCGTQLFGDRSDPGEQVLHATTRLEHLPPIEIDEGLGEAVPDRAPEVLLDQPVRVGRKRLALVHRPRDAGGERVH